MSMTRKEALNELLTMLARYSFDADEAQAIGKAMEALRPVSRGRVEQVWRGEWIECQTAFGEKYNKCSRCGFTPSFGYPAFCASCGSANTGEAVQMVMERLEALYETT